MKTFHLPWGNWYGSGSQDIYFPDEWNVRLCSMIHHAPLTDRQIQERVDSPIGCTSIDTLARGKKTACIITDDISRPTPGSRILPIIIKKLIASGIPIDNIKVLIALGAHRPMTRQDMEKKIGKWVIDNVEVRNHNPFASDLVTITDEFQVIKVNRIFADADLKISVGSIVPHSLAGFSGGAKAVIPGIGGIETLHSNHSLVYTDNPDSRTFKTSTLNPDNPMRNNMEKIVKQCGLDFIINVVLNDKMEIAEVFAGDFILAHRAACDCAKEFYRTELVREADIVILSAYPKDTEYSQIGTAFSVLGSYKTECLKPGGTMIVATAASEGSGYHSLFGPGMSLFSPHDDNVPPNGFESPDVYIFSTGVKEVDIKQYYIRQAPRLFNDWNEILNILKNKYDEVSPIIAVYPMGSIQIGCFDRQ